MGVILKSTGVVYNCVTLEKSWQLPGPLTQDPLLGSDLTGPLGCTKSFDLQLHFDALSPP